MGALTYLLDADWIIDFLSGRPDAVSLIARLAPAGIALSAVTHTEVMQGVRGSRDPRTVDEVYR
jgi:predicted nucleic acid-binding protein